MSARTKARKRALDVLFEADLRSMAPREALAALERRSDGPLNPYTRVIVDGVVANSVRIDELLATYSNGWTMDRMPVVDRNLLRIGTWEIMWADDVPDGVAISEAVELASDLSTDESGKFVNGVLGRLVEVKQHLVL
jgi:transcription antitermination protein NusB